MKEVYVVMRYLLITDPRAQHTLEREVKRTTIRNLLLWLSPTQLHWVLPGSTTAYKTWIATRAKEEDAPVEVVTELIGDDGAKLHWIGRKDAKKMMLHFHSESSFPFVIMTLIWACFRGGGFALPLHHGQLSLHNYFRCEIKRRSNIEVKVAFLEYSTCSGFMA